MKIFHIDPRQRREKEMASLSFLQKIGVPAPLYIAHGSETEDFEWLLQTRLKGETLWHMDRDAPETDAVYRDVGAILARLQDGSRFVSPRLKEQSLWQRWVHTRRRLEGKPEGDVDVVRQAVQHLDNADLHNGAPSVFVHYDFSARNFLVASGENGRPLRFIGLIDFEKSYIGDPWADLAILVFKTLATNRAASDAFCDGFGRERAMKLIVHPNLVNRSLIEMLYIVSWAAADDPDFCAAALSHASSLLDGTVLRSLS
ncbi:MAG: aminoglycoside phosphotransferase family protein [Rhizobiaceae bacterium]|nr:aminoglycoside phosphotransferase family protein [Rhizobiaceae bacterium]